ncbi:hypothetical protein LCGC14_1500830 [marine sediment metagenome]|uniref:Uncharacterized protein n=1 Tax=marine sediment metagenome TaxID=412755 RepID=A0A0F9M5K8_9ZZZZ
MDKHQCLSDDCSFCKEEEESRRGVVTWLKSRRLVSLRLKVSSWEVILSEARRLAHDATEQGLEPTYGNFWACLQELESQLNEIKVGATSDSYANKE